MPHSPARWLPYSPPETSRLLKVNHYVLHVGMKMRSGGCVAFSQDTDTDTGAGGGQEFRPLVHDERYGLPGMDVCIS